ncbi:MAG: PAS domain-containing protein, partial [Verrucomicrobia bacterium]|nr:PAS domain-containing protein [Verrucomicrobiota bacterium]
MSTRPVEILTLVASAGGHAAITAILRGLPADFSIPIMVMQHLGPDSTATVEMYARRAAFEVEWVQSGTALAPRKVLVCPPRSFVELLPNGTCVVARCDRGALDKPIDCFLESVARSFGHLAIGVVLTGMGSDGAAGARQLHLAGGRVLVQNEASAEYPEMPRAAIRAGAADLVVPLADLGQVIAEVVAGTPRPKGRSELEALGHVFGDKGGVAAIAREIDWAQTPLGPVISWPAELRLMARTAMDSACPMGVWWGPELIQIYNDEWRKFLGAAKHPPALGGRARDTWREIWHQIGPMVGRVMTRGEAVGGEDFLILIERHGYPEEVFVTFSYAPIRDAGGTVVGVHTTAWETTKNMVAERRMGALRTLAAQVAGAGTPREACELAAAALASDPADLPFALLYLLDPGRRQATLAGVAGLEEGAAAAPRVLPTTGEGAAWPLARVLADASGHPDGRALLDDLAERFPGLSAPPSCPAGTLPPRAAFLLALRPATDGEPIGVLVAGLSPHRPFDDGYGTFLDLVAQQVDAGLAQAQAKQLERERLKRLAELDRAKTEFFANVSHEFRTPLTLLLAPLDDLLRRREALPAPLAAELDVAARNARRLLTLVNNLLDFSQIEARRQRIALQPVDLCAVTADVVSAFRSAIEAAGLHLRVECDAKLPPVPLNRELWEKVVSNLLSNAFKFTFEGEISVALRALSLHAELVIADTGVGIPAHELPNLFKRFHRVRGARARTAEGSGIGLSIVQDLVSRMGGQLTVRSVENQGTAFTIWMPYKSFRHSVELAAEPTTTAGIAADLAREASRWLSGRGDEPDGVAAELLGPPQPMAGSEAGDATNGRLVVVDDNADMRDYLYRLLAPQWQVEPAADGATALDAIRRARPEAVLADVMMPGLDGFELLKRVREDSCLKHTPVVLLTARAGEEAAIEGLRAGADDYVAKPFSPRELTARLRTVVERARGEAALRESEARFRAVANLVPDLLWRGAPDGGTTWYNQRWLEYTGKRFEEAIGWGWMEAIHPEDRAGSERRYRAAIESGTPLQREHRIRRHDGRYRWFLIRAEPLRDAAGQVVQWFGSATDVDDFRRAADALRASEERLRAFVTASSDVVYQMNPDWTEMRQLYGRGFIADTQGPNPRWFEQYIPPDDRPQVMAAIREAVRTKTVFELEHRVRRVDRSIGWTFSRAIPLLDPNGEITEWFGTATDVTPRKEADATLRASEEWLQTAIDAARSAAYEWDLLTDEVTANARFREIFSLSPGEKILGSRLLDKPIHDSSRDFIRVQIRRATDPASDGHYEIAYRLNTPAGPRWMLAYGQAYFAGEGSQRHAVRIIGMDLDITALKTA